MLLLKKYLSFSLGIWINAILSFISTPIISWIVTPTDFGKISMYSSLFFGCSSLVLMGTTDALMRFFDKYNNKNYLVWICAFPPLLLSLILFVVCFFFKTKVNYLIHNSLNGYYYLILPIHVLLSVLFNFNLTIFRISLKGIVFSIFTFFSSLSYILIILLLFFLNVEINYNSVIQAQFVSSALVTFFSLIYISEYWKFIPLKFYDIKKIFNYCWPLVFGSVLWWLTNWVDRFMLRFLSDFENLGIYSVSSKVASVMTLFTTGFSTIWYPYAYKNFENESAKKNFIKAADVLTIIMFLFSSIIIFLKNFIFKIFFPVSYSGGAEVTPFLIIPIIFTTLMVIIGRGINFAQKTHISIYTNLIAIFTNIILNFLFIRKFGAVGAGIATAISFFVIFIVESTFSIKLYPVKYKLNKILFLSALFIIINFMNIYVKSYIFYASMIFFNILMLFLYKKDALWLIKKFKSIE